MVATAETKHFDVKGLQILDLDKIDKSKNYEVTLALMKPWRSFGKGRWVEDGPTSDGKVKMRVDPAIHTGVFRGKTVQGLVSASNDWIRANRSREEVYGTVSVHGRANQFTREKVQLREGGSLPVGDINKMAVVLSVKISTEAPDEPVEFTDMISLMQAIMTQMTETAIPAAVNAAVAAAIKETKK